MNRSRSLATLLVFLAVGALLADPLTLEQCVDRALANNLQHLQHRQSLIRSYAGLQQAQARFNLQANANLTMPEYSERRETTEIDALETRVRTEDTDFQYGVGLKVDQRIPHIGLLSVSSKGIRRDFTSNRQDGFVDYDGNLELAYSRQILSDPWEEIALKQAQLTHATARSDFGRRQLEIEGRVTGAYYDLVQSIGRLKIQTQRLEQSKTSFELAQRKFEVGLIAEVDALKLKVELLTAEADFAAAETSIEARRDQLRRALGMKLTDSLKVVAHVDAQRFAISEIKALDLGLRRNSAILSFDMSEEINQLNVQRVRDENGPRASLNLMVGLRGQGAEIGDVSNNLERNRWRAGIQVGLPLIDGGSRRSSISQAQVGLEETRLGGRMARQNVALEIRSVVRGLKQAESQIDLANARIEVAERTYVVQEIRFAMGQIESQDLLEAQIALTRARNAALDAAVDYQRQLMALRLATMAEISELIEKEIGGSDPQ